MAAKKARKRAYIPPSHEVVNKRERTHATRTQRPARGGAQPRRGYEQPKPGLMRTVRRLPIYFVLILALQYWLNPNALEGNERWASSAAAAGLVTLIFAPFMHLMDRFAYNRYLKHTGQAPAKPGSDES